ncbi:type II toxin-antitoxin system PemK/MazF family toxin [Agromyces sp. Soil535]|uniref:type II toxin-antitoxin system PemK/MazF family toxin n=1 Tax=Agromyces sp. Soil535 TaxID=1736390 RepID=UPI0006F319F5|nr:type II toxin-antitoxin system PemK/MazF family toxin [Agromyces sp. Soil535]KRE31277.1 mRNA interferase MazF9 [Agromyces sp. Soil535]
MRRGDVVVVSLDPVLSAEASKSRPCVLVSNDGANSVATRLGRGVVTVVPLTSNVARVFSGFEALVSDRGELATMGLRAPLKAQAAQLRAVSVERVRSTIGRCPARVLDAIDEAIRFHLSL